MAIGLIIGVEFNPSPTDFQELLEKRAIKGQGFQYVALRLSTEDAENRKMLKSLFQSACVKQEWLDGLIFANALQFSDIVVSGKRMVIVEPRVIA